MFGQIHVNLGHTGCMRNVLLAEYDTWPVSVLPIATDYPPGHLLDWHQHRRAQLLYGASGTMLVQTADGAWTVPGHRAVLIPPQTPHQVRFLDVQTNSLYIEPAAVPWWPAVCQVVEVTPLVAELLHAAADLGAHDLAESGSGDRRGQLLAELILVELPRLPQAHLHLVLPEVEPFASLCRSFLADPDRALTNADWAARALLSERSFTRQFTSLVGSSPAQWRARAVLLAAIPLLSHRPVTEVAGFLGYSTPAAFSHAFSQAFGMSPSSLREQQG